jgi:DNA-binding response OmpR family regulator/integrase
VSHRILVVEDDDLKRLTVEEALTAEGYEVRSAATGTDGLKHVLEESWDLALLDLKLPGVDGLEILKRVRAERPDTTVMMMTAFASIQTAVDAMKMGAYDYLAKPFTTDELLIKVRHFFEFRRQRDENVALRRALDTEYRLHSMVASSRSMRKLLDRILIAADSEATVLIVGETGTGKELVAEAIHNNSPRRRGPLVRVSCVALRESLIESELFGHEKGAFSGAIRTRPGRFELANGGTLFLDDIDDAPLEVQPKLLRVLQSHVFERVGGERAQLKGTPRDIFDVLIRTGLRVGECLALKPSSYDPLHNVLVIERPKEQRQAEVPVAEHVRAIVESRMDGEWLFPRRDGRPYTVAGIRSIFKRARDRAGLRKYRLHDLRRTAATHMVKRGMNIRLVQAILRHKSLDVTARYVGIDRQDLQRAADALNDLGLGGAPAPRRAKLF